ncbi:MAG: flagellar motor protein MotB [Flavobacterium sp.]|nr:flagellar motor protein MotB [Flavobacterium sp.]
MKIKYSIYSFLFSFFILQGFAQKAKVAAADKKYDRFAYVDAITVYERVAEKGYKDEKMFQKLGNAYYFNGELEKAAKWYGELFAMNQAQEPEYFYKYSQCLKSIGDYTKADKMLEQFNVKSGNDQRAKLFVGKRNYLNEIKENSGRFNIMDAGVNSINSDYGTSFFDNKLIFCSARDSGGVSKKIFKWTGQPFTDLYSSEIKSDGNLSEPELFGGTKVNSKFNEATPVFTKDGKTMYFTRNNFLDGKKGKDTNRVTLLKLYKATFEDDKWGNVTELPFNNDVYSVAHPALSPDDKILYFVSDMPGTLGQSDLFKVTINDDGSYTAPENLGSTINTEGRESFPFISEEHELYFASDGRPGLGGLDIFVSKINQDSTFNEVQNVGAPVNGQQNDFAFLIDSKSRNGFFSSNRVGGPGSEDIYKFTETRKLICEQTLTGIITDFVTGLTLPLTKVSLFDEKFQLVKESSSDYEGKYSFDVECSKKYYVRAEKQDYETKEGSVIISKISGSTDLPIAIEKSICKVAVGDNLGKCFGIKTIYFALDKSNITKEAEVDLEKIVVVLNQNPKMKIDIRSHTDSRQTDKYNMTLSDKRSKAALSWLVKNGIEASRLSGKGYGETQLINNCTDGVKCSEAEHQANRRSEFIIVE